MRSSPAIGDDPVDVTELRREMTAAEMEDIIPVLLETFLREAPPWLDAVVVALGTRRMDHVCDAAHAYRSGALSIRAHRLAAILHTIEGGATRSDEQCMDLLPELVRHHRAASEYLERVLSALGGTALPQ